MIKIETLPFECKDIKIEDKHWTILTHRKVGQQIWVVYLNIRKGGNKIWILNPNEYWKLEPKHGTRDRFVKDNFNPTIEDPTAKQLFFDL